MKNATYKSMITNVGRCVAFSVHQISNELLTPLAVEADHRG